MTSRVRGCSSMREGSKVTSSRVKDRFQDGYREDRPLNSGCKSGQGNRYHFGMARNEERDEASKNGRDYGEHGNVNADVLYKKSKEHFGAWDIKDIVQDESSRSRRQTDRLTNGRSRAQDRCCADVDDVEEKTGIDRSSGQVEEKGPHRLRKKERWESSDGNSKICAARSGRAARGDERGDRELLKEIENLSVVDGRSGEDRRIGAMIERFKSREEDKSKLRPGEWNSIGSTEREGYGSRGGGRGELRTDRVTDINDRDRGRIQKDDPAGERGSRGSKLGGAEKYGREEVGRSGSVDRRMEKFSDPFVDKRRSKETVEDDVSRRRENNLRRRSYAYDGNPDDFEVRIQRYERGVVPEAGRRDADSFKRVSSKESGVDPGRRDSFKDPLDRQVTRKTSFNKCCDARRNSHRSRDRESSKDRENDPWSGKSSLKSQDAEKKYSGRENPEQGYEGAGRKNSFKESDYGRILSKNRDNDEEERKRSFKGHNSDTGVSRITFEQQDADSSRAHSCKDREADVGSRVSFDRSGRKNSSKEKSVEFGGISYRDDDDDDEAGKARSFRNLDEARRRHSPNGRYVEFGGVSFQSEADDSEASPSNDRGYDSERRGWSRERGDPKRRGCSSRSRNREEGDSDKRSDRHSRPLTPPKREGGEEKFDSKAWHESNRIFAANYIRENSRYRANPEGRSEIDRDPSPEFEIQGGSRDRVHRSWLEEGSNLEFEGSKPRSGCAKSEENRAHALGKNGEHPSPRDGDASRYASSTHEGRNGATIIRIRSSPETGVERRRRRRPAQDAYAGRRRRYEAEEDEEDSEEDEEGDDRRGGDGFIPGRGVSTPSRRVWNYREGGVLITDVEEGQPCLQCGDSCSGFSPHTWRKNCTSCKCPREAHDVCHEEWVSVRSRLGLKGEESSCPATFDPRGKGLAWAPPGLPAHKVEEYFSMLPEKSVPRLGTPGERYRDRQLAFQLPKQDLARAYCRHLNPKHASSADDFMAARNEIALDIGSVQEVLERDVDCGACHTPLKYGTLAVSASKLGLLYHPACFRCTECKELLVDLAYCVHDDTLFCERHYAEQLKPRCAACDELIFSGEYTKAMSKDWHSGHFCCWQCDESLTGQRYVLRDEHPYCIKCYESVFANGCEECNKIIGIDSKDLSYKDKHWHEACFLCNRCRVSLVDKQFGSKVDKIYCGNCYDAQFASRCDGCGEIFRAGTKKMEYKTRQWHEKCFCCVVCKNPIGTKSFIPREQEIYCAACYEDKFATRCVKCNKIITSGGVTYKNEPWHRDCFTCSNCNNSLAGQRFTSRDDKPYCADCFGELFAKRCTACSKPITGIGGTRFISFEDRHWHNDCFICAGCKTSLVGRGFITDGEDIICPDCAKMKLM